MKTKSMISYQGNVTLKIYHGDKEVKTIYNHNEGSLSLMSFLVHCLGGDYHSSETPKYIKAYYNGSEEGFNPTQENQVTLRPIVTNFPPKYIVDNSTTKAKVQLTFLIPNGVYDSSKTINRLALYNLDNRDGYTNYLAWIKTEPIALTSGESLMIVWEMTLANIQVNE